MKSETLTSRLIRPEVRRAVKTMGSRGPTYPLTAQRCVDLIVTNLAVIKVTDEGLALQEVAPGVEADEVQATTAARLIMEEVKVMDL